MNKSKSKKNRASTGGEPPAKANFPYLGVTSMNTADFEDYSSSSAVSGAFGASSALSFGFRTILGFRGGILM